jgi:3',5'-nucleoside bisphosphate phosphatase
VPANLHLHSNFSDGTLTPAEVVDLAASAGLGIIAITDHDTDEGVELASRAGDGRGIDVISGIEVSAMMPAREVHILGYGFEGRASKNRTIP